MGLRRLRVPIRPNPARETDCEDFQSTEVSESPGKPKLSRMRQAPAAPVVREEVLSVHYALFNKLPPEVWNHFAGSLGKFLRNLTVQCEAAYREGIEEHLGSLLDQAIPQAVYQLGRDIMEGIVSRERGFHGSRLCCDQCDGILDYEGDRPLRFMTRLGEISARRAYYRGGCGHTAYPLDSLLGLEDHRMLPEIQELLALFASRVPFEQAVETLSRLLPIQTSVETAERVTAHWSDRLKKEQADEREAVFGDPKRVQLPICESSLPVSVAVVAADGGMCRMRDSQEPFEEFKLGVLGQLDPCPGSDDPPKVENKHYVGHFSDPDTLFEYMTVEFYRMGLDRASVLHFLGDGAEWLWPRAAMLRSEGQELSLVLDFYHSSEHVQAAANVLFGPGATEGTAWYEKMRGRLYEGKLSAFFRELERRVQVVTAEGRTEAAQAISKELRYFRERRHLLRYKECRTRGLPIGSGMVEGGIRFVGKDRLDRTGMRWTQGGAEAVLQLRCLDASKRWDDFFRKQSQRRLEKYRSQKNTWLRAA